MTEKAHFQAELPDDWCYIHNESEPIPADGAYRVCFECSHVFPTEQALIDDIRSFWEEYIYGEYPDGRCDYVPPTEGREIFSCPHCAHDF